MDCQQQNAVTCTGFAHSASFVTGAGLELRARCYIAGLWLWLVLALVVLDGLIALDARLCSLCTVVYLLIVTTALWNNLVCMGLTWSSWANGNGTLDGVKPSWLAWLNWSCLSSACLLLCVMSPLCMESKEPISALSLRLASYYLQKWQRITSG